MQNHDQKIQPIKVLIADDHVFTVQGIKHFLEAEKNIDIEVVGTVSNSNDLVTGIRKTKPSLIFLDLNMPERPSFELLPIIKTKFPELRIIAFTSYDDSKMVKDVLRAGVDGYILKNSNPSELIEGVKTVMDGKVFTGTGVKIVNSSPLKNEVFEKEAVKKQEISDKFQNLYRLTNRETEILKLLSQGLSNKEMASRLYISDQTVSVHRKNIMRKLNVNHIAGLVRIAIENGLI